MVERCKYKVQGTLRGSVLYMAECVVDAAWPTPLGGMQINAGEAARPRATQEQHVGTGGQAWWRAQSTRARTTWQKFRQSKYQKS